jgi:spore maturation protein CgeB/glycosyltransferase involved in cell wall biosynthesis
VQAALSKAETEYHSTQLRLAVAADSVRQLTGQRDAERAGAVQTRTELEAKVHALRGRAVQAEADLHSAATQLAQAQARFVAEGEALRAKFESLSAAASRADRATAVQRQHAEDVNERLRQARKHIAALTERNQELLAGAAQRIGMALIAGCRSPLGALRLPAELWRIGRDAAVRRAKRRLRARTTESSATATATATATAAATAPAPAAVAARSPLVQAATPEQAVAPASPLRRPLPASLRDLRVAAVMDEFTFHSFSPECNLLALRPDRWQEQLDEFDPDVVFVESAWRGADELWLQKVSSPSVEVMSLLAWCRAQRVPSVFWNKEDPVHYGSFQHIARAVDQVFTTDIDCIARYKRDVGHDRVYLLPFAAQPSVHNPIECYERRDAFCFAGSYYLRYPERQRDFESMMRVVQKLKPVEIYDRNYIKRHPHYEFPPEYDRFIVGTLPFDQIDKAYKGYRFGINMNTIKQSQTMFARRVFELLASNTIVASNFSRGVRMLFGDLVVCSDAPVELQRRLAALADDETLLRRFRAAGLRKVLAEHTYAHRLAYIASKVASARVEVTRPSIAVFAFASDAEQVSRLQRMFDSQTYAAKQLRIVAPGDASAMRAAIDGASWIAPWCANDHYGPHYLEDLALATTYSDAGVIGKATHYNASSGTPVLLDDGSQYRAVDALPLRAAIVRAEVWRSLDPVTAAADIETRTVAADDPFAIDELHYCRDAVAACDEAAVATAVDDADPWSRGVSLAEALLPLAEAIAPAHGVAAGAAVESLPGRSAAELAAELPPTLPTRVSVKPGPKGLVVHSTLAADRHAYIYLNDAAPRADWNLELNSRVQLLLDDAGQTLEMRTVFEFLDENRDKIGHAIQIAGASHTIAIPSRCVFIRFGLRIQGAGRATIRRLVLADPRERPTTLIGSPRHLLLTKQYPAYDDLYKYGFVHSRVRAYCAAGLAVDVFRVSADESCTFREFEDVDVIEGDRDLLEQVLRSGRHTHLLIHLLDEKMWEAIERHAGRIAVTIWVHGAEIQMAHRRSFEHERFSQAQVARKEALAERRREFWRRLFLAPPPNTRFVFVSDWFARESLADLGLDPAAVSYEVIHNFIDTSIFFYRPKTAEHRLRILSIRPFVSRKYANDLTVAAIQLLAERPFFDELFFHIVGEGELFDTLTRPLVHFANVKLEQRFLTQGEIATLHADYGIFLSPTRMDAQGVSRDEAMASGLVPISNHVAAVPEFVDPSCGLLVDPESAEQLAAAIEGLFYDPQRFLSLSCAAAERVVRQSGATETIDRELALLRRT